MSKSYNKFNDIFLPDKELKKVVLSIITDSTPLEQPKNPDTCNVFALYKLVGSPSQVEEMRQNYLRGGYGYGHAKTALYEVIVQRFEKERKQYNEYMSNPAELEKQLEVGADKARKIALKTMERVREKIGF